MEIIQITLLWTMIFITFFIGVSGYLYLRTRQYINVLNKSFKMANDMRLTDLRKDLEDLIEKELKKEKFLSKKKKGKNWSEDEYEESDRLKDIKSLLRDVKSYEDVEFKKYQKQYVTLRREFKKFYLSPFSTFEKKKSVHVSGSVTPSLSHRVFVSVEALILDFENKTIKLITDILEKSFLYSKYNLDNEIKDKIVEETNSIYGIIKGKVISSKIKELNHHELMKKDINEIDTVIEQLSETLMYLKKEKTITISVKVLDKIKLFTQRAIFLETAYKVNNSYLPEKLKQVVTVFEKNKKILLHNKENINKIVNEVRMEQGRLESSMKKIEISKGEKYIRNIKRIMTKMEKENSLTIDSYQLLQFSHNEIQEMVLEFESKKEELIIEIQKNGLDNQKQIEKLINQLFENVRQKFVIYRETRLRMNNPVTPYAVLSKQVEVVISYKEHLKKIENYVTSIKKIIQSTKDVMTLIGELNIAVLNAESKLKNLPKSAAIRLEGKLKKYKETLNQLLNEIKQPDVKFKDEDLERIKKFEEKVKNVWLRVERNSFLSFYVKEMILISNLRNQKKVKLNRKADYAIELYSKGKLQEAFNEIREVIIKMK